MIRKVLMGWLLIAAGILAACSGNDDADVMPEDGQLSLGAYPIAVRGALMANYYTLGVYGPRVGDNGNEHFLYFYLNRTDGDFKVGDNLARRSGFYVTCTEAFSQSIGGVMQAGYRYHYTNGDAILLEKYSSQPNSVDSVRVKFHNLVLDYDEIKPGDDNAPSFYIPDENGKIKIVSISGESSTEHVFDCHVPKQLRINGEITF